MAVELRKHRDIHTQLEREIKSTENGAEKMRRRDVLDLSQDLLRKLNPSLSSDRVRELFFSSGDVLAKPLIEISSEIKKQQSPMKELNGWDAALSIAHFYNMPENRDLKVPERAIVVPYGKYKDEERAPEEKVLMYISAKDEHSRGINFEKFLDIKTGFRKKTTVERYPPDVVFDLGSGYIQSNSIKGADNLIIIGSGSSFYEETNLQAEGRCAIMQDTSVKNGKFYLEVGGDIHQYGGIIEPVHIKAQNYIQHEGSIKRPNNLVSGSYSEIDLAGEYHHFGGEQPDPAYVKIRDINHERELETEAQIFVAEEGYEDAHLPMQEVRLPKEKLKNHFEETYAPHKEAIREETDGSVTKIQSHIVQGVENYADLMTDALAAGWNVADKADIPGYSRIVVTLSKRVGPEYQGRDYTLD